MPHKQAKAAAGEIELPICSPVLLGFLPDLCVNTYRITNYIHT